MDVLVGSDADLEGGNIRGVVNPQPPKVSFASVELDLGVFEPGFLILIGRRTSNFIKFTGVLIHFFI